MEHLFSIGKFAKMCNTTVDTLNHYEHLGLLSPAYINETHRRFYDIRQYNTFCHIQHLTEIGTPLAEIKEMLQCGNPVELSALLGKKERSLRKQLYYLQSSMMYFDDVYTLNQLVNNEDSNKPFIYIQPTQTNLFATLIEPQPNNYVEFAEALKHHKNNCDRNNVYPFPTGLIIPRKSPFAQIDRLFFCFSPLNASLPDNKTPVQPAGEYAAILHKGSFESLHTSIQLLLDYISASQYIIAGDTYISFYNNSIPKLQDTITLIKIHIVRKDRLKF